MKYLILLICILAFSNFAFSQVKETEKSETEITVCPVKLLGIKGFITSYRYVVETNNKGAVKKVEQLGKDDYPKFI